MIMHRHPLNIDSFAITNNTQSHRSVKINRSYGVNTKIQNILTVNQMIQNGIMSPIYNLNLNRQNGKANHRKSYELN